jgi:DNA (cytosine-5)-methyltransferase 1
VADLTCLEICAGAGGQSIGLEQGGFRHVAAVEIDADACATLRLNRPEWNVIQGDVHELGGFEYQGVDLLAGGVPCPPFSIAGKQLGADDERDLFPQALRLIEESDPGAVMLENVRGLSGTRFERYREQVLDRLQSLGYQSDWRVLNACDFGVPQLRPRFILVALKPAIAAHFAWPTAQTVGATVGDTLLDAMSAAGWPGAPAWSEHAQGIAPTLVGGSRKHGGPDLGPTRAREAWLRLSVDGRGLADAPPGTRDPINKLPRLTVAMAALIQGFPPDWRFSGRKTAAYRQVGNAFPPPVAAAVGAAIREAAIASRRASAKRSPKVRRIAAVG